MTVREMIECLETFEPGKTVVIETTDLTAFVLNGSYDLGLGVTALVSPVERVTRMPGTDCVAIVHKRK